ncbi:MAG: sterol desaturase family protein [Planctomycetota bacterium]|nr:sterol desaturase family protein [Planctomycetota bacterium]
MDVVWSTLISLGILLLIFLPLELLFPGNRRGPGEPRGLRKEYGTDLLFALGQYVLWTAPVVFVLVLVYEHSDALPLSGVRAFVGDQPFWLQFLGVILLCDIGIYWGHRLSHKYEFLWRFHRVHHTAEKVDWIAAYREHPFDNLYTRLIENLPAILLGFPLEALAGFAMFRGLWAIYIHSNVALEPGPLRYLLGSPRLHHWHHEIDRGGRVNFANLSPLMDLLFGTYYDPGHMPERYGIPADVSHNYVVQLVDPLLPAGPRAKLQERLKTRRERSRSRSA